jgi:hypothetical protein
MAAAICAKDQRLEIFLVLISIKEMIASSKRIRT